MTASSCSDSSIGEPPPHSIEGQISPGACTAVEVDDLLNV